MTETQRVVVVGGGLAGLAAAAALAERGIPVTLLEARPRWGGRVSSFVDRETGETIDNCQHLSMGCCVNFHHFCDRVGIGHLLQRQRELHFVGPDGAIHNFAAGWLPAPLHLMGAFRKLTYLSRADLRTITRGLKALCRYSETDDSQTFADWLQRQEQSAAVIERFWNVVLISALSETSDRIDIGHARKVFVDGFLANRRGWEVRIPTVPLSEFYGDQLTEWFANHDCDLRLQTGVSRIVMDGGRVSGVELRSGETISAADVILAVPHHIVSTLLPENLRGDPFFATAAKIESAPISSVHLWFDRPITPLPHAALVGRLSQWMFNRSPLQSVCGSQESAKHHRHYYQVVISASRMIAGQSQSMTIETVVQELAAIWPDVRRAALLHSRLITERKAVFSVLPGIEKLRPPQQTPIANLQLAGDWTATGWPATMEGAVRSGYLAAENVLARRGCGERILQPDYPTAFLSKWLLGL